MKCFEIAKCNDQDKKSCIVWNTYKDQSQDFENIKCWILKGVYQEENKAQFLKCRKCPYYTQMNQNTGISSNLSTDVAIITCEGSINNDKTRALDQVWTTLKKNGKFKVLMDLSNVSNIYSCGLGELIKIHKEAEANKGILVILGAKGSVSVIFTNTKLTRLLHIAPDQNSAIAVFDELKKKELAAIEAAKPKPVPLPAPKVKTRIPCWIYWKGKKPTNATNCNQCFKMVTRSKDPCWIIEGMVEGISFQYVNEECASCSYFEEFSNCVDSSEAVEKNELVEEQS